MKSTEKYCAKCLNVKPRSEYNKQHTTPDGLRNICRTCQRKQNAAYRAKKLTDAAYQQRKRAKNKEYCRTYWAKNRARLNEERRVRRHEIANRQPIPENSQYIERFVQPFDEAEWRAKARRSHIKLARKWGATA